MGYRDPDKYDFGMDWVEPAEPAPSIHTGFADQFEDDASGLLFFRRGIGRPVRVTAAERDWACDEWQRRSQWITHVGTALGIGWLILFLVGSDRAPDDPVFLAGLGALALTFLASRTWLSSHITRRFLGRTPCGPNRTRWANLKARSELLSWGRVGGLAMMIAVFAIFYRDDMGTLPLAGFAIEIVGSIAVAVLALVKAASWWDRRWGAKRIG